MSDDVRRVRWNPREHREVDDGGIYALILWEDYESLRTKRAKKDKRIRELELINAKQVLIRIETEERLAEYEDGTEFFITDAEIDAAVADAEHWRRKFGWSGAMWELLGRFKIFRCKECGGSGEVQRGVGIASSDGGEDWRVETCKPCHGHGWIRKEYGDE